MEENTEKKTEENKDEEEVVLHVKRHLYPEEIELKKQKKELKEVKTVAKIFFVIALFVGWLGGSLIPFGFTTQLRNFISRGLGLSDDKIEAVKEVLENDWYFGKDIDDLDERLTNQAIEGMVDNEEDTHTLYFSKQESEDFKQSINRNYCGIGVEYIDMNGTDIITKVIDDTPAEKAGLQAGDIMVEADGKQLADLSTDEIKELIQGKEGTSVTLKIKRDGKIIAMDVERKELVNIASGRMLDDGIAYLQLYQFGDSSADTMKKYIDQFKEADAKKLILDLRDNGGGYLSSVTSVAGLFLEKGSTVLQREDKDGNVTVSKTTDDPYCSFDSIVILINQNTASAAEVLTLAMDEQMDNVTLVGTKSYGKGSVQVERKFSDGSSLNYTTQRWLSPNGTWVNGVGITPDDEVKLHDVFYHTFIKMSSDESYSVDQVSGSVSDMQLCLDYLGYKVDRTDGYFSEASAEALKQFQSEHNLNADGILNKETYDTLYGSVRYHWATTTDTDTQLAEAVKVLNEK